MPRSDDILRALVRGLSAGVNTFQQASLDQEDRERRDRLENQRRELQLFNIQRDTGFQELTEGTMVPGGDVSIPLLPGTPGGTTDISVPDLGEEGIRQDTGQFETLEVGGTSLFRHRGAVSPAAQDRINLENQIRQQQAARVLETMGDDLDPRLHALVALEPDRAIDIFRLNEEFTKEERIKVANEQAYNTYKQDFGALGIDVGPFNPEVNYFQHLDAIPKARLSRFFAPPSEMMAVERFGLQKILAGAEGLAKDTALRLSQRPGGVLPNLATAPGATVKPDTPEGRLGIRNGIMSALISHPVYSQLGIDEIRGIAAVATTEVSNIRPTRGADGGIAGIGGDFGVAPPSTAGAPGSGLTTGMTPDQAAEFERERQRQNNLRNIGDAK
jgi:hypothetical protein